MDIRLHRAGVELDARRFLTLEDALGTVIVCMEGELWITQHGDTRDHFVRAGEAFTIDRTGRIVVQAQRPARVTLEEAHRPPRPGWIGRWLGAARLDTALPALAGTHGA